MENREVFRRNLKVFGGDFYLAGWWAFPHEPVVTFSIGERDRLLAEFHCRISGAVWQPDLFNPDVPRGTY